MIAFFRSHFGASRIQLYRNSSVQLQMPLDGLQALQVWNIATAVQSGGCTVPDGGCCLRCVCTENRLYVSLCITRFTLPNGNLQYADMHITLLTVEAFRFANGPPNQRVTSRAEDALARTLRDSSIQIAGDLEPIFRTDAPHRIVMTIHAQSRLHATVYSCRHRLLQTVVRGRVR